LPDDVCVVPTEFLTSVDVIEGEKPNPGESQIVGVDETVLMLML